MMKLQNDNIQYGNWIVRFTFSPQAKYSNFNLSEINQNEVASTNLVLLFQ